MLTQLMAVALAGACLGACSGANDKSMSEREPIDDDAEAAAETTSDARVIGTIDESAREFALANGTGAPVGILQVRGAGSMDFGADLLSGKPIEDGEEVLLRLPAHWEGVDLSVTLADDASTTVLAGVSVTSPGRMTLAMAGDAPCLNIEREDGAIEVVEAAVAAEEPPVTADASVSEAPAEEVAAPETTYEPMVYSNVGDDSGEVHAPVMPEVTYEEPSVEYEVPMEAPAATEQTADSCIDDVMLKPTA